MTTQSFMTFHAPEADGKDYIEDPNYVWGLDSEADEQEQQRIEQAEADYRSYAAIGRRMGISEAAVRAAEKSAFEKLEETMVFHALLANYAARVARGDEPPAETINDDDAFLEWLFADDSIPYTSLAEFEDDPVISRSRRCDETHMIFTAHVPTESVA